MLAEIAMCNAAYGVLRQAVVNGRELADYGREISNWVNGEEALKEKAEAKKKNPLNKIMGKDATDFEEFLALEKINQQKKELQSMMRLYGRAGLYDDWVEFSAKARKARLEARKKAAKERQELIEGITLAFSIILAFAGVIGGIYFVGIYMGKW